MRRRRQKEQVFFKKQTQEEEKDGLGVTDATLALPLSQVLAKSLP